MSRRLLRLELEVGSGSSSTELAPTLGQFGLNVRDFCKRFDQVTLDIKPSLLVGVVVILGKDNYEIKLKGLCSSDMLKRNSKLMEINILDFYNVSRIKYLEKEEDIKLVGVVKMVKGTLNSMGIKLVKDGKL